MTRVGDAAPKLHGTTHMRVLRKGFPAQHTHTISAGLFFVQSGKTPSFFFETLRFRLRDRGEGPPSSEPSEELDLRFRDSRSTLSQDIQGELTWMRAVDAPSFILLISFHACAVRCRFRRKRASSSSMLGSAGTIVACWVAVAEEGPGEEEAGTSGTADGARARRATGRGLGRVVEDIAVKRQSPGVGNT